MLAGAARIDITPTQPVWMDGMIRAHRSTGVHDALFARCLALGNGLQPDACFVIVSVEVCALDEATCRAAQEAASAATGIPSGNITIAATHTHSGPATHGFFNPREDDYNRWLIARIASAVTEAAANMQPAALACGSGQEQTISHYRRLLADDGHVVMNWETHPAERLRGPLGVADHEVGVLKVTPANDASATIALLFNHAGHPNVMSGDNLLISSDYPGQACRLLEQRFGGVALFVNGAQGSVDIDGLRDRDWEGVQRLGAKLAQAVADTADSLSPSAQAAIAGATIRYALPARKITPQEWAWANDVLKRTGGSVTAMPDGVGDDYLAVLYKERRAAQEFPIPVQQSCLTFGDCAFVSFPGELYTEIGAQIKARSPFRHTYIIGLANGYVGYVPTRKAIGEGGYSEDTRRVDAAAEDIVVAQSLALLQAVCTTPQCEEKAQ
jgi:hypothetical protein